MDRFKVRTRIDDGVVIERSVDDGKTWPQVAYVNTGAGGSTATLARDIVVMMNILADHRVNHCPDALGLTNKEGYCSLDDNREECRKCWDDARDKAAGEVGE